MKCVAITNEGLEDITLLELKELINVEGRVNDGYVMFSASSLDACFFSYKAQSVRRVLILLSDGVVSSFDDISKISSSADYKGFLGDKSFAVRCIREGSHDYSGREVEEACGEQIEGYVNLDDPDITFISFLKDEKFLFGIDLSGFDLSKRKYMVFSTPSSIKGTIAYGLVRLSGYDGSGSFLDPVMKVGAISIEAELFSKGISPHFFSKDLFSFRRFLEEDWDEIFKKWDKGSDKKGKVLGFDPLLKHLKNAQKNAIIAGVKEIEFSKVDLDWLDTKLSENSIKCVASYLPSVSKNRSKKEISKEYDHLFYGLDYILSGNCVFLVKDPSILLEIAFKKGFKEVSRKVIHQGQEGFFAISLKKVL